MRSFAFGLARRNLRADTFATLSAVLGVALGVATVNVVLVLDDNTRAVEARRWTTNPDLEVDRAGTLELRGQRATGAVAKADDAKKETHEDYQIMRSAVRLGSLSAYLVGALIVFFTFRVVVEERRREIALLRSLGSTPRQVASVFLLEAVLVGVAGALLGLLVAPPLALAAGRAGITTTGRAYLGWVWFPWGSMLFVSAVGALTAVLGVLPPLFDVLRLDVPRTLRPRFLDDASGRGRSGRRRSGVTLLALPFMALLYALVRPFFHEALPSLTFFVLEAGLVSAAFLSMLVLVPEVVRTLGRGVALVLPRGPRAARLLTLRRVERMGHDLSWAVSGIMLVFALLLALHLVTHALKREVGAWARGAIRDKAFVFAREGLVPEAVVRRIPPALRRARFTARSPWPNALMAVDRAELRALVAGESPEAEAIAARLVPGTVILSSMMARRFGLGVGDVLEARSRDRTARLEVVAVTDDVGYVPMIGAYRNGKTYGVIAAEDYDLIAPYASGLGSALALRRADPADERPWSELLAPLGRAYRVYVEAGEAYERARLRETDKDFALFDLILFLTGVLAAIGVANNLVLSAHMRRRELALYRVLGMEVAQIRALFLTEGAFIGLLGGLLAVGLGVPLGFSAVEALQVLSAFAVRFELPPAYALWTVAGALAVSLASALYPAARAARYSSAESVHYE